MAKLGDLPFEIRILIFRHAARTAFLMTWKPHVHMLIEKSRTAWRVTNKSFLSERRVLDWPNGEVMLIISASEWSSEICCTWAFYKKSWKLVRVGKKGRQRKEWKLCDHGNVIHHRSLRPMEGHYLIP